MVVESGIFRKVPRGTGMYSHELVCRRELHGTNDLPEDLLVECQVRRIYFSVLVALMARKTRFSIVTYCYSNERFEEATINST